MFQGLTVDLSEPLWRIVLDTGKCVELAGDRVLGALTQYETLLPELLSDLKLALENSTHAPAHLSRARMNAAVLWSAEWGLEEHSLALQVKFAARDIMRELRTGQIEALEAHAAECVAAVADWDWRSNRLGKMRFDREYAPAEINVLDPEEVGVKVTSGAAE